MKYKRNSLITLILSITLLGSLFPGATVLANTSPAKGIDVSQSNGTVDWDKVKEQGVDFAMIRTGQGKDTGNQADIDKKFEYNYEEAGNVSIKRGVYHLIAGRTVKDAIAEAQYCLSILDGRKLEYPVAYDIESPKSEADSVFSTGKDNITAMAVAFSETIKAAGYTPMIYASSYHLNKYFDYNQIKGYKIWVAHHDVDSPNFAHPYFMWQYGTGHVDGANTSKGICDLNYSYDHIPSTDVKLSVDQLTLGKGESFSIKASLLPASTTDKVKFTSVRPSVATVTSTGKIIAKKAGTTIIEATSTSKVVSQCIVVVKNAPSSIRFVNAKGNKLSAASLKRNQVYQLKTSLTKGSVSNKKTYVSSNKSVVYVNSSGKIKGLKKGSAYITVKTFNNKTAKIKITVK